MTKVNIRALIRSLSREVDMKRCFLVLTCLTLGGVSTYLGQSFLQGRAAVTGTAVIPKEFASYRDVVKKVLPAVVSIEAQSVGGGEGARPGDMQLPGGPERFFGRPRPRGVDEESPERKGFGSGFLISAKGIVVTNNHVVTGADQVLVQLRDGRKFTSKKIKADAKTDLAIITLDAKQALPFLEFGDSNDMEIGDRVLAIGAPFGLTGTVTQGIISSKGRALRMNMYEDFLQTDAAINPGNSGGPLISLDGKVIGINSAIKSRTGGFQGIGMAISSNLGKKIVDALLKEGVVRRGYLGVSIRDVDEAIAQKLGLKEAKGVQVREIFPDAPGAKAGMKSGDVILSLGGKIVKDSRDLQLAVAGLPLGKPIEVLVIREGKEKKLKVTIEEQPKAFGTARRPMVPEGITVKKIGVTVADLTDELAEALGYPETVKGALITRMEPSGLAAAAKMRPGMVIVRVDKKAVANAKALEKAIAAGSTAKGITVQARSPSGGMKTFVLKAEEEE
jgi:serine protease Do